MGADLSVRVAWSADAAAIASVQLAAWVERLGGTLPEGLADDGSAPLAAAWRESLERPPSARHRALVALDRVRVAGFVMTGPATDPDLDAGESGEVLELTVAPDDRGQGHGSRLVQAAVDTLVADGFTRAVTWVATDDDALRAFLTSSGWAPDGGARELAGDGSTDAPDVRIRQVRLHVGLV